MRHRTTRPAADVAAVVADAVTPFRFRYRWRDFPIFHDGRPRAAITPQALRLIVDEVVSNACRYSHPHGPVRMEVREADGQVVVTVLDEGDGIDTERLGHLFDEDLARTDEERAGLGVAAAVAAAFGGSLEGSSRPGRGARFVLRLPAVIVLDEAADVPAHRLAHPAYGRGRLAEVIELFPSA